MTYNIVHYTQINQIPDEISLFLNQKPATNFEIVNNLGELRENPKKYGKFLECIVVYAGSKIQVLTFRVLPFKILISHSNNLEAIPFLVKNMVTSDIKIPGVFGPLSVIKAFTERWENLKKENFQTSDVFWLFILEKLQMSTKKLGSIEIASLSHEKLLHQWSDAAVLEIIPKSPETFLESCRKNLSIRIKEKNVYILMLNKEIVSMGSIAGKANKMQLINNVYTPPKHRNKGYATELCTYIASYIRNEYNDFPILTVLTTNKPAIHIYQNIGFKKIDEVALYLKQNQ